MNRKLSESKAIQAIESKKKDIVSVAESIQINKKEDIPPALEHMAVVDALLKEARKEREKVVPKLHQAHRAAVALFDKIIDPLKEASAIIKKRKSDFDLKERQRIEAENRKREEETRKKEEAKQQRLRERAKKLEEQGREEEAELKREEAENYVAPAPEVEKHEKTTKTEAGTMTTVFDLKGEVVDPMAVAKAIVDGRFPISFIEFKNKEVQAWINAFKPKPNRVIDGLKVVEVPRSIYRGAK